MKKLICLLLVTALALAAASSCRNWEHAMEGGSVWFIQASNVLGFSDKETGVYAVKLSKGWMDGRIQCLNFNPKPQASYRADDFYKASVIGDMHFDNPYTVTISGVWGTMYSEEINGTWTFEHDLEYDTHILRRGNDYIIF